MPLQRALRGNPEGLAYLKRFPIDTLKIDRAFIRDITSNADDAAITLAIIAMAHNLKLKVIAEGVETAEQLLRVAAARLNCMGFGSACPSSLT